MNSITATCEECFKEYAVCPNCVDSGAFKWRLHYCSRDCFRRYIRRTVDTNNIIKDRSVLMKVQYNKLTYKISEYDLTKGIYITSNGLELKESEIEGFILELSEFKKIKEFKLIKSRKKQLTNKEEIETEEDENV